MDNPKSNWTVVTYDTLGWDIFGFVHSHLIQKDSKIYWITKKVQCPQDLCGLNYLRGRSILMYTVMFISWGPAIAKRVGWSGLRRRRRKRGSGARAGALGSGVGRHAAWSRGRRRQGEREHGNKRAFVQLFS